MTKLPFLLPAFLLLAPAAPARADSPIPPAVVEQMALADKLVALGDARRDPLLLIAAARLKKSLDDRAIGAPASHTSSAAVLERARKLAGSRRDLAGLIDDLAAQRGRGPMQECGDFQRSRCDKIILY